MFLKGGSKIFDDPQPGSKIIHDARASNFTGILRSLPVPYASPLARPVARSSPLTSHQIDLDTWASS